MANSFARHVRDSTAGPSQHPSENNGDDVFAGNRIAPTQRVSQVIDYVT